MNDIAVCVMLGGATVSPACPLGSTPARRPAVRRTPARSAAGPAVLCRDLSDRPASPREQCAGGHPGVEVLRDKENARKHTCGHSPFPGRETSQQLLREAQWPHVPDGKGSAWQAHPRGAPLRLQGMI